MTSYGYTIDLLEFQVGALERILKHAIADVKNVEPDSREATSKQVDAAVARDIIEKLRECERNFE